MRLGWKGKKGALCALLGVQNETAIFKEGKDMPHFILARFMAPLRVAYKGLSLEARGYLGEFCYLESERDHKNSNCENRTGGNARKC